jgi:hypothetical protein
MWQFIKDLVSGTAAFLRLKEKRQELDNTPEMQANGQARVTADIEADATKAVADGNLDEIRKQAAE